MKENKSNPKIDRKKEDQFSKILNYAKFLKFSISLFLNSKKLFSNSF